MNGGLDRIVAWIEAETGLCFPEVHHQTIRKAAHARSGELGLEGEAYETLLRRDEDEKARFFSEIMIGETYFFRDEKQFVILGSDILPELMRSGESFACGPPRAPRARRRSPWWPSSNRPARTPAREWATRWRPRT